MRIAFILTSFNRVKISAKCIEQLERLSNGYDAKIYMTDDNSPDNTYGIIKERFPKVNITKSIGNLYWGRGMYVTWTEALKDDFDVYIWVNDDNILYDYALEEMLLCAKESAYNSIICGSFCDEKGNVTYGGVDKKRNKLIPNGQMQEVHYMNGNFVLVPKAVVSKIGIIDPVFIHIKGDYDYGLTAIDNGLKVLSTKRFVGLSPTNPVGLSRGRVKGRTCRQRLYDSFHSPFLENPSLSLYFNIKHHRGIIKSLCLFIKALLVDLIPDKIYYRLS